MSIAEQLAERVGVRAGATEIFGEPVVRDGVTVIPVARSRWGFGGGGSKREGKEDGGGGGGAAVTPTGYIELTASGSRYRPIRDPLTVAASVAVASIAAGWALRGLAAVLRASPCARRRR